ncbi:hypothetical protein M0802_009874 [Mischocyttarus mexicanus]|nr:hypothetical protein M0802_009874 [Mischocyttarus mexicanus]
MQQSFNNKVTGNLCSNDIKTMTHKMSWNINPRYAWVTLATNDAYSLGALVLAHSLRRVDTKYELAVLVTPGVTNMMREKLAAVFNLVQEVNVLDSKDEANLALLARPELGITFTKLHCWRLTQYEKCVFVDADTLVVRNCDELFEREELSAAHDVGWPDCFNSGVFVFRPSQQTFASITAFAAAKGSFDGGDQGLLNIFGEDVRIIHFIGITKPWLQYFDTLTGIVQPPSGMNHLQPLLQLWWNIFCDKVHPQLSSVMATSTLAPIWHNIIPLPFVSFIPSNNPIYNDTNYESSYSDVYSKTPDFSEFKDPWENYSWGKGEIINTNKNNENVENVQYFYDDNNKISEFQSNDSHRHCTYEEKTMDHNYHKPPSSKDSNQFHHPVNYDECSTRSLRSVEYTKYDENVSSINEHKKHDDEVTKLYSKDNYEENYSKESEQYGHWKSDQYQHSSYVQTVDVHQHVQEQQDQEQHQHHLEFRSETNDNDNKSTSDNSHVDFHIKHEIHNQHVYRINQQQESNTISHSHQQQQQQHYYHEHKDSNQDEQKEIHYRHNVQQTTDFIQSSSHDSTNNIERKITETIVNEKNNDPSNIINKQTDKQKLIISYPSSKPCTDLHNVATQSDLNLTGHLDSSNAGLAGALAQMTLGEPRSAEQIALEEHMRKQSWEQGQIDYMGRDSFDNIWKKICETLSFASRQPSPPPKTTTQDEIKTDKTEETNAIKKESTDSVLKSEGNVDIKSPAKAETTSDLSVKQSLICNIPKDDISQKESIDTSEILTKDESVNINKQSTSVCEEIDSKEVLDDDNLKEEQLPRLESIEISERDTGLLVTQITKETDLPSLSSDQTTILKESLLIDPTQDVTVKEELSKKTIEQEKNIVDIQTNVEKLEESSIEQDTKCSSVCASEIMLTNPVPIQVAESVLQAEPKESVSQDLKLITEEVISSTVAPLQESVVAFSETPIELTDRTQLCDSTLLISSNETANIINPNATSTISQNGDTVVNGSTMKLDERDSLSMPSVLKQVVVVEEIQSPKVEESQSQKTETLSEQLSPMESTEIKQEERTENVEVKKETESESTSLESKLEQLEDVQTVVEGAVAGVVEKTLESSSSLESMPIECPIRPTRTKEISIPSTPTVTEPTPPTSPVDVGTQDVEGQGKIVKKTTKKVTKKASVESDSAERADTEATEKKTVKKVVKKVVKKPKESQEEGGESSSSTDKPKKTGKSTKKLTKPSSSLETDTSIPETPPPGNSDVPVPPKRKVKASTSNKPAASATPKSDTGS